jgi:inorganic triphosphatase YgiF
LPVLTDIIPDSQVATIQAEATPILAEAKALIVKDEASYQEAQRIGMHCAKGSRAIEALLGDERAAAHSLWKSIVAKIKQFTDVYDEAKKIVSGKAYKWEQDEKARIAIETEKLRKEAERKAEEERLAQAEELEKAGNTAMADAILDEPINVAPPVIETPQGIKGTSSRENWQYEIFNESLLPRGFLIADTKKIGKYVKDNGAQAKIPGVRVWDAGTIAFKTK